MVIRHQVGSDNRICTSRFFRCLPQSGKAHSICKRRSQRASPHQIISQNISMDKPKIRAVEAFPVQEEEQTFICLRDPSGLAPEMILLGMGAYFIVTLFDGAMSLKQIQAAFSKRFGAVIPIA